MDVCYQPINHGLLACQTNMAKGAVYPRSSNFTRWSKTNIVSRMRKYVDSNMFSRPRWMTLVERAPPLELHEIHMNSHFVANPYPELVAHLLRKYPNLRFQDCFVRGNNWTKGNDYYRDDHPVMQFVAYQLNLMQEKGFSRKEAFKLTERVFYERRMQLEREQKIHMALNTTALNGGKLEPMFTSAEAYWHTEIAKRQEQQYSKIAHHFRLLRAREELRNTIRDVKENKVQEPIQKKSPTPPILTPEQLLNVQRFTNAYREHSKRHFDPSVPETDSSLRKKSAADAFDWSVSLSQPIAEDPNVADPCAANPPPESFDTPASQAEIPDDQLDALLNQISHMMQQKVSASSTKSHTADPEQKEWEDPFDALVEEFSASRNISFNM